MRSDIAADAIDALVENRERIYYNFSPPPFSRGVPRDFERIAPGTIDELCRLARLGLASRDLAALHRVLEWLVKYDMRRLTLDYCEGEVRVTFDTRGTARGPVSIGTASDFAGAVDIAESEGWDG